MTCDSSNLRLQIEDLIWQRAVETNQGGVANGVEVSIASSLNKASSLETGLTDLLTD